MQEEQEPRTDHPAEGVNVPYPGIKTAHDMEEAEENLLVADIDLESNELHAGGRTCARCGRMLKPGEEVRRNASGAFQHDTCPPG
jgi:hypothetical protein